MILFKQAEKLSKYLQQVKQNGKSISFVPTMGALHKGHLSLLDAAKQKADVTVSSIFVNPTQFNNAEDFRKYPNTIESDIEHLANHGCNVLFLPVVDVIYPAGYEAQYFQLNELETVLEGHYRPGHFQGVCQVVDRLLGIVNPDTLLLGQKDFQQCMVIRRLLQLTGREEISLIISPTIREADGLAMSSRNLRLTTEQRAKAPALYAALKKAKEEWNNKSSDEIKSLAIRFLTMQGFKVDYFEIADSSTLLPATDSTLNPVILVAAYLGDIRLIDNL